MEALKGKKTYFFGTLSILAAVYLLATGAIDMGAFTQILSTALVGMGIRAGIAST